MDEDLLHLPALFFRSFFFLLNLKSCKTERRVYRGHLQGNRDFGGEIELRRVPSVLSSRFRALRLFCLLRWWSGIFSSLSDNYTHGIESTLHCSGKG